MDQTHPDKAAVASPPEPGQPPSEGRRSGLWRAVAGMLAALAIAAAIVAVDLSHQLVERISNYHSRIANLNRKMDLLKEKAVEDEKRLAAARAEINERKLMESQDRVKAILIARDRRMMKLTPPAPHEPISGTVTMSEKMGGAVLSATALPALRAGQVYDAWWMLRDAPPAKAAEFRSAIDGNTIEYLDLPPQGATPVSLSITVEPSEGGIAPGGPVKLQGKVPAIAEARGGQVKKR